MNSNYCRYFCDIKCSKEVFLSYFEKIVDLVLLRCWNVENDVKKLEPDVSKVSSNNESKVPKKKEWSFKKRPGFLVASHIKFNLKRPGLGERNENEHIKFYIKSFRFNHVSPRLKTVSYGSLHLGY